MIIDVLEVVPLPDHRLRVRFDDGFTGEVDIAALVPFRGVFAPLADPEYFARVRVNPDTHTVEWPNRADIDPSVLRRNAH